MCILFITFVGRDRLEMSDSTLDSPKPSDRFDNFQTKIRNRETRLEIGFTVSSDVYKAAGVDHRYVQALTFYCISGTV